MKAILIDLDGTLVKETEKLDEVVMNRILKKYFIKKTHEFKGYNLDQYLKILLSDVKLRNKIKNEFLKEYYNLLANTNLRINPEVLKFVKNKNFRLALVTSNNKKCTKFILKKLKLINSFEIIITCEDVKNHKPHPEPYLKALQIMNLLPSDCLALEDSILGVRAASDAGIKCVLVGGLK